MEKGLFSEVIAAIPVFLITLGQDNSNVLVAIARLHRLVLFTRLNGYLSSFEVRYKALGKKITLIKVGIYLLIFWNFILCFWFYFLLNLDHSDMLNYYERNTLSAESFLYNYVFSGTFVMSVVTGTGYSEH